MVVNDFYTLRMALSPFEADSPLVIYTDAVLSLSPACKTLQSIRRRHTQVLYIRTAIQHPQLSERDVLYVLWEPAGVLAVEDLLGLFIPKTPYHGDSI